MAGCLTGRHFHRVVATAEIVVAAGAALLLLDSVVRADLRRVRALLHLDFVEFGASGRI